jgi:hypothetical protein
MDKGAQVEAALRMATNDQLLQAFANRQLDATDPDQAVANAVRKASDTQLRKAAVARGILVLAKNDAWSLYELLIQAGGAPRALAQAGMLAERKSRDYNGSETPGAARDKYFPLGLASYAQMIHTKSQRLLAFADTNAEPNFESVRDTALDLINYASFLADWLEREGP